MRNVSFFEIAKYFLSQRLVLRGISSFLLIVFLIVGVESLQNLTWDYVRIGFLTLSLAQIIQALAATFLSYFILGCIEFLNLKKMGVEIKYHEAFYISWTASAISNHFSFAGLSGAAVRLKHLEERNLDAKKVLYLTILNSISLWIGYGITLFICALIFSFPHFKVNYIPSSLSTLIPIGAGAFLLLFFSMYPTWFTRAVEKRWKLQLPSLASISPQFILAALDWLVSGFALYSLLPQSFDVSFGSFSVIFLSAQLLGVMLNIPGGIGVLESIILAVDFGGNSIELMGSLVFFRLIYYILPLAFCLFSFGFKQLRKTSPLVYSSLQNLVQRMNSKSAPLIALLVFIQGIMLTNFKFSALDPLQMIMLTSVVPPEIVKISQGMSSIVGIFLIIISAGLFIRSNFAWLLSVTVSTVGVLLCILSGLHVEQCGYLFLSLNLLIWYRKEFYRNAWVFNRFFSFPRIGFFTVAGLATIGMMNFYSPSRAPSSEGGPPLQAAASQLIALIWENTFVLCLVLLSFCLIRMMWPSVKVSDTEIADEIPDDLCKITSKSAHTLTQLAFLGDKKFLFNLDRSGFIMYQIRGHSWIAMGDPVGNNSKETIKQFTRTADLAGGFPIFYQIRRDQVADYYDLGFKIIKIGEESIINLQNFNLEGPQKHSLRNSLKRVRKSGVEFKILAPGQFLQRKDEFEAVSNDWLQKSLGKEKGFSLGNFDVDYLARYFHAVLLKDGKIVAFANIWKTEIRSELSVDLMRYSSNAPSGAMDYLFLNLIRYGQEHGYKLFNLGMSPLSGLEQTESPLWNVLGALLFEQGDRFYNFQGVRNFKNKFDPHWESRYVAYKSTLAVTSGLVNVAHIITNPINQREAA